MTETRTRRRAEPLPPDERRRQLVAAAVPLVRQHGRGVTTKAVATAAGVSEATVFHVFRDKESLIQAVVEHEFATDRTRDALAQVDPVAPLHDRIVAIVELLRTRLTGLFELMTALGMHRPPRHRPHAAHHQELLALVTALLRPDAAILRRSPERTAELIRLFTFAASHPAITDGSPLPAHEIADLLLHGIVDPAESTPPGAA